LDLEEDFDAFHWCCNDCHGDCGEEACGGDLSRGELVVGDGGEVPYEGFTDIIALPLNLILDRRIRGKMIYPETYRDYMDCQFCYDLLRQ
jgi:hypothetical protein